MQRLGGPSSGQGLGVPHSMAQAWGGGGKARIGCKYFAYCLIKHTQTSEFSQRFIGPLLCAGEGGVGGKGRLRSEGPSRRQRGGLAGFRPGRDAIGVETAPSECALVCTPGPAFGRSLACVSEMHQVEPRTLQA